MQLIDYKIIDYEKKEHFFGNMLKIFEAKYRKYRYTEQTFRLEAQQRTEI